MVAGLIICLCVFRPVAADSVSLENKENFYINYSTYDDGSLPLSNAGYNLTSGDTLLVLWNADNTSATNPHCVYLLNDYQFHGWDETWKYNFLDPASRGYLRKVSAWAMNMSYTVTSTDMYHVIIDNPNWILSIYWPKILIISYQAVQNYPNSYYLTVKTDTAGAASISGEGWYLRGYNKILTAPSAVTVNSSFQYRFNYWDVDGASYGIGVNPITVQMNANHTATAHFTGHELLEHEASFSIRQSTYDDDGGLLVGSVAGYSLTAGNMLHLSWDGHELRVYLLSDYQFHGWHFSRIDIGLDPASRSYIQRISQNTGTIDYSVTSSGTYYVIIVDANWGGGIAPINGWSTSVNYYDAFLDLPPSYYLSVKSDPSGVVSISGGGWYSGGSNVVLTAPTPVAVSSSAQYVFDYWDVDSIYYGSGVNPITIGMAANHTATAHFILQYQVSFMQSGLDSSVSGAILTVNNIQKQFGDFPCVFWKNNGSVIAYSFAATVPTNAIANQFALKNVTGPNSPITITNSTTVQGNYGKQYYLTVASTYGTVGGQGWYDSGSSAYATVTPLTVSGSSGTQYVFTLWSGDASGSSSPSSAITMNAPKTAVANWKTQYYLTVRTDPVGIVTISGEAWYDNGSPVFLTAPFVQNYTLNNWDVDGTSQGNGINPITLTMNSPHIATAHYLLSNPLTVHIQPTSATITLNQSVTFTSTVQGGTLPYNYQWHLEGNPVLGATGNSWTFTPLTTGIHYIYLQVTDFNNNTAHSETARIVVIARYVGGYSISIDKQPIAKPFTLDFAVVAGLALFFVAFRRKTRKERN